MPKLSLAKLERHLYSAADRLRQEGLDAATYKDYIFGMLFLKRCSDVFDAENEKLVGEKVLQGMELEEAQAQYGENPDYYDGFFVPERARWKYLQDKLNDATVSYGSVLDIALGALSEANESLEHVLEHISFLKTQGAKRLVSDDCCKDLVRHFGKHRLRNEDFQFSDLLGAAYEFLINMFAESAGKKGGDFYTPRDVIRLMVRILKPSPGMSVYDPTCGSGGMLIISREFIEQSGGDPTNLRICGQVNDASAWSICRLNMLLHGVPGADIQLQDTLLHPMHREAGELERFDRVIANPPFSPPTGRAMCCSSMPTPSSMLAARKTISALSTSRKSSLSFDRYQEVSGYARVVPLAEIASDANDYNLNIRRYVDNSPPPEPHDVRAHLLGGVPVAEVTDQRRLFDALGFKPEHAFAERNVDAKYYDFAPAVPDRVTIRPLVESDLGVQTCLVAVRKDLAAWWMEHSPRLAEPRQTHHTIDRHQRAWLSGKV
jgi:type I restriction-modification system DNA methylase subunit